MDDRFDFDDTWAKSANHITSGRKPSEIFHEHVGATFMRDRTAILNRELIGRDNIMWGSDYPHFDGAWPDSVGDLQDLNVTGADGSDRWTVKVLVVAWVGVKEPAWTMTVTVA